MFCANTVISFLEKMMALLAMLPSGAISALQVENPYVRQAFYRAKVVGAVPEKAKPFFQKQVEHPQNIEVGRGLSNSLDSGKNRWKDGVGTGIKILQMCFMA